MTGLELLAEPVAEGIANFAFNLLPRVGSQAVAEIQNLFFNASRKYVHTYRQRHCQLKVLGMREPVDLAKVYTGVKFLDEDDILGFESPQALEKQYRQTRFRSAIGRRNRNEKRSGIDVANEKHYLMVLGAPGAGKSTFLRKLGLEALRTFHHEYTAYHHRKIPVLLELKRFEADDIDIAMLIAEEFGNCGFPAPAEFVQQALRQGKLLILLDGLDEVPTANLDNVICTIQDFVDRYDQNRFVGSCRTAAYHGGFTRFSDVGMADFDNEQIEQFIVNWFSSEQDMERATSQRCWETLQEEKNRAAKELAHTPLLLTFLCLVYDRSQRFPANRSSLYQRALRILLEEWAAEKRINRDEIYEGLSIELEEGLLSEIAYAGFEANRLFFSRRELTVQIKDFLASNLNVPKTLDGEAVLQAIEVQQGILVERAEDAYSFSHLTLQEYLTAQCLTDNHHWEQVITAHAADRRWREVLLLTPGLLTGKQGANQFLAALEQKANQCLRSIKLQCLTQWATDATANSLSSFNPAAKRVSAIYLALALNRELNRELAHTHILERARALALALDPAHARIIDINLARTLTLNHALTRVHESDLDITRAIARGIILTKRFASLHILTSVNCLDLLKRLQTLKSSIPTQATSEYQKQIFQTRVLKLWFSSLGISPDDWHLSPTDAQALADYFYICELMIRCKQIAVRVSPQIWAGIESRLMTAPTEHRALGDTNWLGMNTLQPYLAKHA
ncbi:signal transduction protein with nacht domain protein [Leptolyngbya sp. Heron Island J]|uniref:NACHT domain-containing protein n=1 Tax=Leptolyngbya sp. Heron Island J TaxID=1385935 RepID=UPI0003B9AD47|nr:NACHT domain-containing protein [Leptolyngbya sp. Heron Island J]ESA33775.1 signal transduction protein with nacht domain protein [Leptolyngbya sp. Heron Island J]